MLWWGALTQQFGQIAASAMKENASDNARNLAGQLVQQGLDAASATFRQAAAMPAAVAQAAVKAPAKAAGKSDSKAAGKTAAKAPASTRAGKAR
jgi:hypothetical protein